MVLARYQFSVDQVLLKTHRTELSQGENEDSAVALGQRRWHRELQAVPELIPWNTQMPSLNRPDADPDADAGLPGRF